MKIIFFGSDDFAGENLKHLLAEKFAVVACVTQPDRPSGRGLSVLASPIKTMALANAIPVLQPEDVRGTEFLDQLKSFKADLFVVIAYGKILPAAVLKIPRLFCLNVHGSLLPQYRGAAPINWAIIKGDKETGFSIIRMNSKMDAGEIITQERMIITDGENSQSLRERMAQQSALGLGRTVKDISLGKFSLHPQDESLVTFAPKLSKELGHIDWNKPAKDIHNLVRGLLPWPAAYTTYGGKMLKILQSAVSEKVGTDPTFPGTIVRISKEGIFVETGKQVLRLEQVHPESGNAMPAYAFAVGKHLQVMDRFV